MRIDFDVRFFLTARVAPPFQFLSALRKVQFF
jgi:hypothetical protein